MRHDSINDLPIPEALFACMLRLSSREVREFVSGLPEVKRAQLALFCHARSHFRETGLLIAKECSRFALTSEGGQAGGFLFDQATSGQPTADPTPQSRRSAVSLWRSGKSISTVEPASVGPAF